MSIARRPGGLSMYDRRGTYLVMCGRFASFLPAENHRADRHGEPLPNLEPSWNVGTSRTRLLAVVVRLIVVMS